MRERAGTSKGNAMPSAGLGAAQRFWRSAVTSSKASTVIACGLRFTTPTRNRGVVPVAAWTRPGASVTRTTLRGPTKVRPRGECGCIERDALGNLAASEPADHAAKNGTHPESVQHAPVTTLAADHASDRRYRQTRAR